MAQGLFQHEARLRHGAVKGVHHEQRPIHHAEHPLHLAAEVGVAGRVDDVDFGIFVEHGRVLGQNGDAALPFQVVGVEDPLPDLLVAAENPRLPEDAVHQRGFTVIHMGDNGNVSKLHTATPRFLYTA